MADLIVQTPQQPTQIDLTSAIIAFEQDELSERDVIILFAHLVQTGLAWQLQGFYGRTAASLIKQGIISPAGELLVDVGDGSLEGAA